MKTKKLLHTVDISDGKKVKKEFLFLSPDRSSFLGIKSGKEYPVGMICFTGKDLTPSALKQKIEENNLDLELIPCLDEIEAFLTNLTSFKIGNVLIPDSESKDSRLKKIHERPPATDAKKTKEILRNV